MKAEILKRNLPDGGMFMQVKNVSALIERAMDEYAQHSANDFAKWLMRQGYLEPPPTKAFLPLIERYAEWKRKTTKTE